VRAENLVIGYDTPVVENIELTIEKGSRWAILGGNGAGKTTLLRTLAGLLPPLSGDLEWGDGLELGYYDQQLSDLNAESSVLDELRNMDSAATDGDLRNYLALFLFSGDDVFQKVRSLSGGEKSRLALAKIIYRNPSLLALDEPTNHLDIGSREALETALAEYAGTIVFITHDRYLAQRIATHLVYIEDGKAHVFDRLSAFEEWLRAATASAMESVQTARAMASKPSAPMSKNQRERLQTEIRSLEERIGASEAELAALEASFAAPAPGMDWEAAQRRHVELKSTVEVLYADLADRLDRLG